MAGKEPLGRPPFNDASHVVDISAHDREVGRRTNELFTRQLIRPLPWDFRDGRITVTNAFKEAAFKSQIPGADYVPGLLVKDIVTDGLSGETISPQLARVVGLFKMVEDKLPDYMGRGLEAARGFSGLNRSHIQWGREELQHSLAAGLILEQTGHKTAGELDAEYQENLTHTWEQPFPSTREMIVYAVFQERQTNLGYNAVAKRAEEEGAPITRDILHLISKDEAYHHAGYREYVRIFHELDPEGTKADVLNVAANYRMPALNLYQDPLRASRDLFKVGAYSRDMETHQVLVPVLKALGFVNEVEIAQVLEERTRIANDQRAARRR